MSRVDRNKSKQELHFVGSANVRMGQALKIGTTRLMLDVIARGRAPSLELEDSVAAIRLISRDADLKQLVKRRSGGSLSARLQAECLRSRQTDALCRLRR